MDAFAASVTHYRWYASDGGEAASTSLENEDTSHDFDVTSGNVTAQLRVLVAETGSGTIDGATTDDYTVRYRKNATGGYANVPASSGGVGVQVATAGLTNDGATTDRATNGLTNPGTGSFIAGEQSTDGTVDDWQLTGDNFSELVFGLEFVKADLLDTDSFEFDISYNGGNPGTTMSVTPAATITKATIHAGAGSAAAQLDGTATGFALHSVSGTLASQLDGAGVGGTRHPAVGQCLSRLDGIATGSRVQFTSNFVSI